MESICQGAREHEVSDTVERWMRRLLTAGGWWRNGRNANVKPGLERNTHGPVLYRNYRNNCGSQGMASDLMRFVVFIVEEWCEKCSSRSTRRRPRLCSLQDVQDKASSRNKTVSKGSKGFKGG